MSEKEYTLTVSGRPPRGRRRRNTAIGAGGAVYVTVGSSAQYVPSGDGGGCSTPTPDDPATQVTPTSKTTWRLIPDPTAVKIYEGKAAPFVGCTVERVTDGTVTRYYTSAQLAEAGAALWVKIDDGEWQPYVIGLKKVVSTAASLALTTQDGRRLITQGNDIDSATVDSMITFALRDTAGLGKTYAAVNIPIVRDGKDGAAGTSAPMIYPAGEWSDTKTYEGTDKTSPVVMYNGAYYVLQPGHTSQGNNPAEDYATNGESAAWQLMDHMDYVFADILMANFAKLGGAVFYGDYMFSQDGTYNGAAVSGADDDGAAWYRRFTDGVTEGTFIPNYMVNLRTGEMRSFAGVFSGSLITLFAPADQSDAATAVTGKYRINKQHKLISYGEGGLFILPTDISYLGSRVMICDPRSSVSSTSKFTVVQPEDGCLLGNLTTASEGATLSRNVQFCCGIIELLAIPRVMKSGALSATKCQWAILAFVAARTSSSTTPLNSIDGKPLLPVVPGGSIIRDIVDDDAIKP